MSRRSVSTSASDRGAEKAPARASLNARSAAASLVRPRSVNFTWTTRRLSLGVSREIRRSASRRSTIRVVPLGLPRSCSAISFIRIGCPSASWSLQRSSNSAQDRSDPARSLSSSTPCTTRPACWRFIHDATSVAAAGTLTFTTSTYAPLLDGAIFAWTIVACATIVRGMIMQSSSTDFAAPASQAQVDSLAANLRERNFEVVVVDSPAEVKGEVLARIPDGAQVHSGKSKTLEDAGVFKELMESDRFDFIRRRTMKMDRATQGDEIRRLGAAPEVMLGSVQAVTEAGQMVVTSASGSQIGPYASGAGKLILVVGSQKIVPDLEAAFRRIQEYVFPWEDARLREQIGIGTAITRTLIIERDFRPGRATVILVREPIGV